MSSKLKKIDNIYYCVLSSSTTEQEAKMAEGFNASSSSFRIYTC